MKNFGAATTCGLALSAIFFVASARASTPDFSENATIAAGGRPNPYNLSDSDFREARQNGRLSAVSYPVTVTGVLPPYRPFAKSVDGVLGSSGTDDLFAWLGLHPFPAASDQGVYAAPFPGQGARPNYRMGLSFIPSPQGLGFSLSCTTCHSANLFGKSVIGMTNRFPRANDAFGYAKLGLSEDSPSLNAILFPMLTDADAGETQMMATVSDHFRAIGVKKPQTLGLDTSLAQVALSMARRAQDPYASRSIQFENNPRPEKLSTLVADSKPAVWWNIKYKDRWLSDGSVVSGNPIYTNILWNEIGRGADLRQIQTWLSQNSQTIEDLTTAVFSSEAPRITDFFPAAKIDIARAKNGEQTFIQNCSACHGIYQKAWASPQASHLNGADLLATTQVNYPNPTPVVDVGTDPGRYQGMTSLEQDLNPLFISQSNGVLIRHQEGYVPPPLVGIWARWPYFHNNSAPSLCAVLTAPEQRPTSYLAREANDADQDFDFNCNGYPAMSRAVLEQSPELLNSEYYYDTRLSGMSNDGHAMGLDLTASEKADLIQFLQTL